MARTLFSAGRERGGRKDGRKEGKKCCHGLSLVIEYNTQTALSNLGHGWGQMFRAKGSSLCSCTTHVFQYSYFSPIGSMGSSSIKKLGPRRDWADAGVTAWWKDPVQEDGEGAVGRGQPAGGMLV